MRLRAPIFGLCFAACVGLGSGCSGGEIIAGVQRDLTQAQNDLSGADLTGDLALASDGDMAPADNADLIDATPDDLGGVARIGPETLTFNLDAGAFPYKPGQPSALVYVPTNYDPTPPIDLVVYIHGFDNCVVNVVKPTGGACATGSAVRGSSNLIAQMESANKNALLVLPEVKFDAATGDPGRLGVSGGFNAFMAELLNQLTPTIGSVSVAELGHIMLMSHSGGYVVTADLATTGGVPINELVLLDSLYGNEAQFQQWIMDDAAAHATTPPQRRFFSVYTDGGGTDGNNRSMATAAKSWAWLDQSAILWDDTTATWTAAQYAHGVMWKHSALSHMATTTYYFQQLVQSSPLLVDK